jgi:hypothetical protein
MIDIITTNSYDLHENKIISSVKINNDNMSTEYDSNDHSSIRNENKTDIIINDDGDNNDDYENIYESSV